MPDPPLTAEELRLRQSSDRAAHWKRWGPYLSERAWGTVREDYSPDGCAWEYFPHDHARSRAYRWNEDGLGGICDRHQYICFALAGAWGLLSLVYVAITSRRAGRAILPAPTRA